MTKESLVWVFCFHTTWNLARLWDALETSEQDAALLYSQGKRSPTYIMLKATAGTESITRHKVQNDELHCVAAVHISDITILENRKTQKCSLYNPFSTAFIESSLRCLWKNIFGFKISDMCFKRKLVVHPDATPVTAATDFSFCNYSQKEAKMGHWTNAV